ncbi:hypothetical protein [Providencia hangzhouensis]|uniref:tail fiber/spike domain-containing protein n=1 Tax=Providencia hangzhouensis TaxID=3031799 RepID=UPI003F65B8C0
MREVKPTQKPVPSSDIKDLFFNSGLLDIWATSLEPKYIDRFGNCHLTAAGMEWLFKQLVEQFKVDMNIAILAAGYAPVGSFQEGAEVKKYNEIVLWKLPDGDGEYYRWDGDLPKSVPENSTPETTGGIKTTDNPDGLWVSVGDASLRSDVKNGDGSLIGLEFGTLNAAIYYVTPEMFAELDTPETYNTNALKAAISHKRPCYLSAKEYITLEPLVYKSHKVIHGAGHELCRIKKVGNKKSGLPDHVIGSNKKKIKLDVDAVMIAFSEPNYWYAERNELNGFSLYLDKLENEIEGEKPTRYVLYAPLIAQSSYTNIQCEGHNAVGVYCIDYWMVNWNRVHSKCDAPWLLGDTSTDWTANGTSNTFISCWATNTKGDNYSWKIENMQYSTMISCGNDGVGRDGKPALGVYHFTRSDVTMINCGAEIIHAESFMKAYINSRISLVGGNFADIFNKYLPKNIAWNNTNALFQAFNNSRISMTSGAYVKALYDFGGTQGDNVQSLAHVDDRSFFTWEGFNTVTPTIKRIRPESGSKRTAFGITFAGNSHVRVITETMEYIGGDKNGANTGTEVGDGIKDVARTYKSIYTESDIESFPQEITTSINLNTLRTRGNVSLHCGLEELNTEANGFPVNGGKYFIKQTSTGGDGTDSRVLQEATRIFGDHQFELWYRTADKGTWFSAWVRK